MVALVFLAGCASSTIEFPNATPGRPLPVPAYELRPPGAGPFPAVVLLHGCDGVSRSTREWAGWFRDHGYVALIVDSWAARGISDDCLPSSPDLPSAERFDDAVGALRWLVSMPYVDRARVGVIGWSNGGVFAMAVVNGPSLERARARGVVLPAPGFQAAVAVYPGGCYSLVKEMAVRPLLVLIGDADDWTVPGYCVEMVEAMRGRGADATIVLYPGAVHYFDVAGQPRRFLPEVVNRNKPNECCGATVGYDATAAADARRRVAEFFGYHLSAK
jgi:dienelactone hydrolase